jgi:hypothetical protein
VEYAHGASLLVFACTCQIRSVRKKLQCCVGKISISTTPLVGQFVRFSITDPNRHLILYFSSNFWQFHKERKYVRNITYKREYLINDCVSDLCNLLINCSPKVPLVYVLPTTSCPLLLHRYFYFSTAETLFGLMAALSFNLGFTRFGCTPFSLMMFANYVLHPIQI